MLKTIASFLGLTLLFACSYSGGEKVVAIPYWDSKQYFANEIALLGSQSLCLQKELNFDGASENTVDSNPDWAKELDAFLAIDLRKPIYRSRLDIDTITLGDSTYQVTYQAMDAKLDLKSCVLTFEHKSNTLLDVLVAFNSQNSLYTSSKLFRYHQGLYYSISGEQEVRIGDAAVYTITGKISANH
jgi:hypothetical protein